MSLLVHSFCLKFSSTKIGPSCVKLTVSGRIRAAKLKLNLENLIEMETAFFKHQHGILWYFIIEIVSQSWK